MSTSSLGETENSPPGDPDPSGNDRDPVEALADEFIARRRKGETPSLDEYIVRCPDRAEEIRELFPAIAAMERWKPRPSTPRQRLGGGPIRDRIGEYRLIREIGRGGMGIVYEAEQPSLNRRVAIKVLPGMGWADDRPMQRFLREAKTTASLRHGNIVPVFAVGQEEELHYYVMPLIIGAGLDKVILELRERKLASLDGSETFDDDLLGVARTLLNRSNSSTPLPPISNPSSEDKTEPGPPPKLDSVAETARSGEETPRRIPPKGSANRHWQGIARIGRQVAEALQHAHDAGVLHRDIKPANLLLDAEGTVWVADFGLAKALSHDDLSRTGDLVGTLRYMAPERFRGESDGRSDLYSLGLTLYELMTLRPAHDVPDRAELIRKIAEGEPTRPRELDPTIPLDLETVVLKSLEADPARRYASAGEMAADLARFADGLPVLARRAGVSERILRWTNRNRALTALATLSLILSLFGGYFFKLWYYAPPRPRDGRPPFFEGQNPDDFPPRGPEGPPPRRFPPPPPSSWIPAGAGQPMTDISSDQTPPAVLALHGLGGGRFELAPVLDALEQAGCVVGSPVLPGHAVDGPVMPASRWEDWAEAAELAFDDLARLGRPVVVVGFSTGATLALLLATRRPVARLLLLAPFLAIRYVGLIPFRPSSYLGPIARIIPNLPRRSPPARDRQARRLLDQVVRFRTFSLLATLSALELIDRVKPLVPSIQPPTLVLQGDRDNRCCPSRGGLAGGASGIVPEAVDPTAEVGPSPGAGPTNARWSWPSRSISCWPGKLGSAHQNLNGRWWADPALKSGRETICVGWASPAIPFPPARNERWWSVPSRRRLARRIWLPPRGVLL